MTIARAKAITGHQLAVVAVVTAPASLLDASGRRIVVQDATAAIEVHMPKDVATLSVGMQVRVEGTIGRAYGAPRLDATSVTRQGSATVPAPLAIHASPTEAQEWRLVTISGRIDTVRKLGDRWRAELRVGAASVVVIGQAGAAIPAERLVKGRMATVVGIVRRPYPTATDRRFAVLPRNRSDVHVDAASGRAGPGSAAGRASTGTSSPAAAGRGSPSASTSTLPVAPDVDIRDLSGAVGRVVRVGGLVVDLRAGGFRLDDGTAIGTVELHGSAADLLDLIEAGDAINVTGHVDRSPAGPIVVADDAGAVTMAGSTSAAAPVTTSQSASPDPTVDVAAGAHRSAALAPFPGNGPFGAAGVGALAGLSIASLGVTLLRRRYRQRRLAGHIARRLESLVGGDEPRR